jgi:transposase-like protein
MANPIVVAAMLSRLVAITCPHCKHKKYVARKQAEFRVCPSCKKHFPDPLTPRRKK